MDTVINDEITKVLESFNDKYYIDKEINKNKIIQDLNNYDHDLIMSILQNETLDNLFTQKIMDTKILKINNLIKVFEMDQYWKNSYTKYTKKIGLTSSGKFLEETSDVILDFPYKDTVLKASMTKEDNDKNDLTPSEPFLNEVIAKNEIDVLLDKKILSNAKKYSEEGAEEVSSYNGESLLIKGNNLLTLHSISNRFLNDFDVIYIDPPYNVTSSNNTFSYNNRFNHSSWLVFMKNRLEIAKKLLKKDDGVLIIAIDENEVNYLGVLLDELFPDYENHLITVIHNPRGVQGTNFSYSNEFLYFVFPEGKKVIEDRKLLDSEISLSNLRNWGGESLRTDGRNTFFPILVDLDTNEIVGFGEIVEDDTHPKQTEIKEGVAYVYPIDTKGIERKWRYARQTIESIQEMLHVVKKNNNRYEIMLGKNFGQYKTVWQSPLYDASVHGKQLLKKLVPNADFSFPKSIYSVYDALYSVIKYKKNAKVLDFFSGSGTTAHAVQMLNKEDRGNRTFVMIEQMPYIETVQIPRLLAKDESKKVTPFIYIELMEKSRGYIQSIMDAEDTSELIDIYSRMLDNVDLNFQVDLQEIQESLWQNPFKEQKMILIKIIDKNQLYYNYSEIDDANVRDLISNSDYAFNDSFYSEDEV
ncbi:site-specific DNA-methyltransferase [Salinicoccus carnicancri]|uniref:site-specific DNA-methyltransferase n=1 Tax=Salinicoccus carnicancri TaxID=558170 RepID=UPI0002EC7B41|nr:site-specific DNA-methyltransferase [Salinicoccus carnicancri]